MQDSKLNVAQVSYVTKNKESTYKCIKSREKY